MSKVIWYISKYLVPELKNSSGAGSRGYFLMRELACSKNYPIVITSDSNTAATVPKLKKTYVSEEIDGVKLIWIKTFKYEKANSIRRIISWFDFEIKLFFIPNSYLQKPDAIIVSSLSLLTIINGFYFRWRFGGKLIFEVRDIWPLTLMEEGGFSKNNPLILFLGVIEKLGYRFADIIVGTMPNLKAHVSSVLGYDKKVYCVPMGYSKGQLKTNEKIDENLVKKIIDTKKFNVIYAGSIRETNALGVFFECASLLHSNVDIEFIIIGDGDLKKTYQKKYSHLKNVKFFPIMPKKEIGKILHNASILYFSVKKSGVWKYGQSLNKLVDYMLAGRPIIASYKGYQSMLNEAGCGEFISPNDPKILKSKILEYKDLPPKMLNKMGFNGRKWVLENRNYQKLSEDYFKIMFTPGDQNS